MQFYVVMPDGSRFGPASMDVLNEWIQQGRLLPGNTVQDHITGQLRLAQDLPGLIWAAQQAPVQPVQYGQPQQPSAPGTVNTTPYGQAQRGPMQNPMQYLKPGNYSGADQGDKTAMFSMAVSLGALLICCCPLLALWGLWLGYTARSKGSYQAGSAIAFAWLATFVCFAVWLGYMMAGHSMFSP